MSFFGFSLLRPVIGAIDAETAHALAIRALETLPLPRAKPDDARLETTIAGLDFANPVGLAAGFDKDARVANPLFRLGFGFVEVGGVTVKPQPGNPKPRVFRLPQDGAVINRYGLNSEGVEAVVKRLATLRQQGAGGILGVNLGANKDAVDRINDYVTLTQRLSPYADFLTLNISSPNTPGLRDLQGRAFLDALLERVLSARAQGGAMARVMLKIAPDLDDVQLDDIIAVARSHDIDGMIVSNTTIARPQSLRNKAVASEAGGLSGKPLFQPSTVLLAKCFLRVEGAFPLIGVGGIASGEDAVAKIAAGASLIQLYSALTIKGPALIGEIKTAILAALAREGAEDISALVGRSAQIWSRAEGAL